MTEDPAESGRGQEPPPPARQRLADRIAGGLPELARYVRSRMGPGLRVRESASDIVQSTARELLRAGRFEERGEESFQRWLRVAAEHKLKNRARHWRALARSARETEEARDVLGRVLGSELAPSAEEALRDERERLSHAVGRLPTEYRRVVQRVHFEGASYAQAAVDLERSPEAVRKLLARALARLSTMLEAPDP